jgi:DNA polymerase III subunit epsilon
MDHNGRFVVFDVETTGLSPFQGDRVIEIGAVAIENLSICDEFNSLVNPGIRIPFSVQRIHGINNIMLDGQPKPEVVFRDFYRFINGALLVAHNAKFDLNFLRAEMANVGLELGNRSQCTLQMSRRWFPDLPNYRLETVARHVLGEVPENVTLHRALHDARLTSAVWLEIMKGN